MRPRSLQQEEELIRNANDKKNSDWKEYQQTLIEYELFLRQNAFNDFKPQRKDLNEYVVIHYTAYIEGAIRKIENEWGLLPNGKEVCFVDSINKLMHPPYRFNEKEFMPHLSSEALFEAIVKRYSLSFIVNKSTISNLNMVLKIPNFCEKVCNDKQNTFSDEDVIQLINATKDYRNSEYKDCTKHEKQRIERLNRLVIEEMFSQLTPRSSLRGALRPSNMTIKMIISKVVPRSIIDEIIRNSRIIKGKDIIRVKYDGDSIKSVTTLAYKSAFRNDSFKAPQCIERFCEKVREKFSYISLNVPCNTIDWLNKLLEQPVFYKSVMEKYPDILSDPKIKELTDEIEKHQGKDLSQKIHFQIKKRNRLLLETIVSETPSSLRERTTVLPQQHIVIYEKDNNGNKVLDEETERYLIKKLIIPKDPSKCSVLIDDDEEIAKYGNRHLNKLTYQDMDKLEKIEEQAIFLSALDAMDKQNKCILKYGLVYYKQYYDEEYRTHAEIATTLDLSRSYISKMLLLSIKDSAINQLLSKIIKISKDKGMSSEEIREMILRNRIVIKRGEIL